MEIIDTLAIGADAQLLVVKAGEEFFLVSKSQKQLSLLTKLELSLENTTDNGIHAPGFTESFRAVLEGKLSRARLLRDKGRGEADIDAQTSPESTIVPSGVENQPALHSTTAGISIAPTAATNMPIASFHKNVGKLKELTRQ